MKRLVFFLILIFVFSFVIGLIYSNFIKNNYIYNKKENLISYENKIENESDILETVQSEEKVSYNAEFALKKYYDECGHFKFQYAELPVELINLTKEEVEDLYDDWEVEEFSSNSVVLCKEINSICDEHFFIKLGEKNVEIYQVGNGGSLTLFKNTDISREYLTKEDIEKLENGFYVYGIGKLNSIIEDFE